MISAWHFVGKKLRNGDPVPPDGEKLVYNGQLSMCESGLHASVLIIDALQYAPGNTICRVECGGEIVKDKDKFICRERTILWRINGEKVLRHFACGQALSVAHLWNMPDVVREYLETEDESKRAAAWAAAWAATTARDAARAATRAAARDAAWAAAWAATTARDVVWAAAWATAWAAADDMLSEMVLEAYALQVCSPA